MEVPRKVAIKKVAVEQSPSMRQCHSIVDLNRLAFTKTSVDRCASQRRMQGGAADRITGDAFLLMTMLFSFISLVCPDVVCVNVR